MRSPGTSKNSPSYLRLSDHEFELRFSAAYSLIALCWLCPRECGAERTRGQLGHCQTGDKPVISSFGAHMGEEAPITGSRGSGTIFFTNCNLSCVFCQNHDISHGGEGQETTPARLARVMLALQEQGCHNINLVTPTHQMPMILEAVYLARELGLRLPLVYNTGGYDAMEALLLLDGVVDIYMPDIKFMDPDISRRLADAPDYPDACRAALREMHRQVGDLVIDGGIAVRGMLVRHLVMPGGLAGTEEAFRFISEKLSKNTYVNIMDQYHPCYRAREFPEIDRRITPEEYAGAFEIARKCGLARAREG